MGKRGQGKCQPIPSSSKSEGRMKTRHSRKKEAEENARKEERSKRLRLHLDLQDGLNNDVVLTGPEGTMRVKLESSEHQVKIEQDPDSLEVATGSGEDAGHLPSPPEVVKMESSGAFQANEIIVTEEVDIPNDDDQQGEVGGESHLLPMGNDDVSRDATDFGNVRKENKELRSLLIERDLENKRLRDENKQLKLSCSNNYQLSGREDYVSRNMDTGEQPSIPTVNVSPSTIIASTSAQCRAELLQTTRPQTLDVQVKKVKLLLLKAKDAENVSLHLNASSQIQLGKYLETERLFLGRPILNVVKRGVLKDKETYVQLNEALQNKEVKSSSAQNRILPEKISQPEGNLETALETRTSRDTRLEMEKMAEALEEKEIQIQQLNKALVRKEILQNHLWTTATKKTTLPRWTAEEKVIQLFPDVLKIIIQKVGGVDDKYVLWMRLLPLLTACRLVCKSWKASVDHIMQQDSSSWDLSRAHPLEQQDFTPTPLKISYNQFNGGPAWANSALHRELRCNPIPTRHLMISTKYEIINSEKLAQFTAVVRNFLEMVGEQVWYLTLDFPQVSSRKLADCIAVYTCLSEWLSLVPNIRYLSSNITVMPEVNWRDELDKIPFPKFKHLVTLRDLRDTHLNYIILKNNSHVQQLQLGHNWLIEPVSSSPSLLEIDLPNLTTLRCALFSSVDWGTFVNATLCKLDYLTLRFHYADDEPSPKQFAEGVARFGRTLKSLSFNYSDLQMGTGEELTLALPQLKCLVLTTSHWNELALEPLFVSLTSLETFSLELYASWERKPLLDYVNNFRDKVDWMKLPKLRNVKLTVKFNLKSIGKEVLIVLGRKNIPSLRFSTVRVRERDLPYRRPQHQGPRMCH